MKVDDTTYQKAVEEEIEDWSSNLNGFKKYGVYVGVDYRKCKKLTENIPPELEIYYDKEMFDILSGDRINKLISKAAKNSENALDLVCGAGWLTLELYREGLNVTGIDINPQVIEFAKKYSQKEIDEKANTINFVVADLNKITLNENIYDVVVAYAGLHHIMNLEHLFIEVKKALKPNGLFLIADHIDRTKRCSVLQLMFFPLLLFIPRINIFFLFRKFANESKIILRKIFSPSYKHRWGSAFEDVGAEQIMPLSKKYFKVINERYSSSITLLQQVINVSPLERTRRIFLLKFLKKLDDKLNNNNFARGEGVFLELLNTKPY